MILLAGTFNVCWIGFLPQSRVLVDVLLDSVKYVIKPYYMMALVKNSRAITRTYTKNLGMRHVFEHVRKVAEVAYIIADNTGKNAYGVNALMYRIMRGPDPKVYSSITQTAIRTGLPPIKRTIQRLRRA